MLHYIIINKCDFFGQVVLSQGIQNKLLYKKTNAKTTKETVIYDLRALF